MSIYFTFLLSFFSDMGFKTGRVIITLYALQLGAKPFTVGALAAMLAVLPTLLSWHAGKFSDRFGSRWLLLFSTAGGAVGMLVSYAIPGIPALFLTSAMCGLLMGLSAPPLQNLVGLQSKAEESAKNFSNLTLVYSFTGFAGPLLAGFSFDHAGPEGACLTLALLLSIPAAMLIVRGGILPRGKRAKEAPGGVRVLLSESGLWRILATSSLVIAGVDLFQVYLPIYGHGIGLSASAIGVVLAVFSLAAFTIRIFLSSLVRRLTAGRLLAYSFLIGAAGFMLMPFIRDIVILSIVSFVFGLGMGCGQPITLMMTFSNTVEGRSGEAMGLRLTANHLTRVVSQFLFGSIGSAFGVFSVFSVNAIMLVTGWALSHPRILGRWNKGS